MNIKFWLDQGTLLGAVRDGKPIDGDNDIDISINSKDFDDTLKVIKQLKEKGYHVKYQKDLPVIDDLIQVYLINDRGMLSKNHIDINIYRYTNNYYVRHGIHESLNSFANRILNIIRVLSGNRFKPKNIFLKMVLLLPLFVRIKIGLFILKIYCNFFKSISQVIPKYFFENFKEIKFLK